MVRKLSWLVGLWAASVALLGLAALAMQALIPRL
jgi:hypothetical protein